MKISLVLAGVLLLTAGCVSTSRFDQPDDPATTAAASPTGPSALDELQAAFAKTAQTSFSFTVDEPTLPTEGGSQKTEGAFDPVHGLYQVSDHWTHNGKTDDTKVIVVGTNYYGQDFLSKRWVRADLTRMKGMTQYVDMTDPTGLVQFAKSVYDADRDGPGKYTAEFDVLKSGHLPVGARNIWALSPSGTPLRATLDDQGRITLLVLHLKQSDKPDLTVTTTFSGFGAAVPVQAPPRPVEAPADFYQTADPSGSPTK